MNRLSGVRGAVRLGALTVVVLGLAFSGVALASTPARGAALASGFRPASLASLPHDAFGQMVRLGARIFADPTRYARRYVGNRLSCSSCHLDQGRLAGSAPMWAAFVAYPAYRSKTHSVNTFAERLQGCFRYSLNGRAPPLGSRVLVALETYSYWLAHGARVTPHLPGRGYPRVAKPPQPPSRARGAQIYAKHCALCHAANGAGQDADDGRAAFPALWGRGSFNWGAGMASLKNAVPFIKANMPFALGGTLTVQQAWDVATFIDSHERPQDPRFTGSVAATRKRYHNSPLSLYGTVVDGYLLGSERRDP